MIEVFPVSVGALEPVRQMAQHITQLDRRSAERQRTRPALLELPARDPSFFVLAAYDDGTVLGYTLLRREDAHNDGMVYDLAVAPEHRRRGVGTALLRAAMNHFRGLGCTWARLNVDLDNEPAHRLYERLGFQGRRLEMHAEL